MEKQKNAGGFYDVGGSLSICKLSGIMNAKEKVVSLEKLRDGLEISIHESEKQRSRDQLPNKRLLVARFTKATCDAFIRMAADLVSVLGGKALAKEAEFVDSVYETLTPIAEATSASAAGQKVDWVSAVKLVDDLAGESPGIAADKAASLERWKSFCRQLPDSDG